MNDLIHNILYSPFWILLAKSILALLMTLFAVLCLLLSLKANGWRMMLQGIETECDIARDMTMLQATVARSELREIQEKLKTKTEKAKIEVVSSLVKEAVPVLSMIMQKETSLLKWGFAGAKLIRSAFEYFSQAKKN